MKPTKISYSGKIFHLEGICSLLISILIKFDGIPIELNSSRKDDIIVIILPALNIFNDIHLVNKFFSHLSTHKQRHTSGQISQENFLFDSENLKTDISIAKTGNGKSDTLAILPFT